MVLVRKAVSRSWRVIEMQFAILFHFMPSNKKSCLALQYTHAVRVQVDKVGPTCTCVFPPSPESVI
jgi:hypothetical protein